MRAVGYARARDRADRDLDRGRAPRSGRRARPRRRGRAGGARIRFATAVLDLRFPRHGQVSVGWDGALDEPSYAVVDGAGDPLARPELEQAEDGWLVSGPGISVDGRPATARWPTSTPTGRTRRPDRGPHLGRRRLDAAHRAPRRRQRARARRAHAGGTCAGARTAAGTPTPVAPGCPGATRSTSPRRCTRCSTTAARCTASSTTPATAWSTRSASELVARLDSGPLRLHVVDRVAGRGAGRLHRAHRPPHAAAALGAGPPPGALGLRVDARPCARCGRGSASTTCRCRRCTSTSTTWSVPQLHVRHETGQDRASWWTSWPPTGCASWSSSTPAGQGRRLPGLPRRASDRDVFCRDARRARSSRASSGRGRRSSPTSPPAHVRAWWGDQFAFYAELRRRRLLARHERAGVLRRLGGLRPSR